LNNPFSLTFNKRLTFVPVAEGQALWTPESGAGSMTESRNYHGFDPDGVANTEADHFSNARSAGAYTTCATLPKCSPMCMTLRLRRCRAAPRGAARFIYDGVNRHL
jgi:hypothetical protein